MKLPHKRNDNFVFYYFPLNGRSSTKEFQKLILFFSPCKPIQQIWYIQKNICVMNENIMMKPNRL